MEDQILVIILVLIGSIIGIKIFINYFSSENDITWLPGDEVPKPKPIFIPKPQPKQPVKENYSLVYISIGIIIVVFVLILFQEAHKKSNLETIESPTAPIEVGIDTVAATPIFSSEEAILKLKSYFDLINNRQFFNIKSYLAPSLHSYFSYKNVSNDFVSNDVINFWENQEQPCRIYYEDSHFEVMEKFDSYEVTGEIVEQSSFYSERIPYWVKSSINYEFNKYLKIVSIKGDIIEKKLDLVKIFSIEDATFDDIKVRENSTDFRKYFDKIYRTSEVKPSIAKRYINGIIEIYGPQLIINYRGTNYSFQEFTLNKSLLQLAYNYGVQSVTNSLDGGKIVTIRE